MDSLYDTDYGPPSMKNYKRNPKFADGPTQPEAKIRSIVRKGPKVKFKPRPKSLFYNKDQRFEEIQLVRHGKSRQVVHGVKFSPKFNMLAVTFSEDGKYIATASEDKSARIWDVQTGRQVKCFEHDDWVRNCAFDFEVTRLCTGCFDGNARVFDIATEEVLVKIPSGKVAFSVCFSFDGRFLATASFDKTCRIFHTDGWKELIKFTYGEEVYMASFDQESERIVTASADGFARIHEVPEPPEIIPEGEEPPERKMIQLDLTKFKIDELKARLKKLQLNEKGKKQELIDRLTDCGGDKTPEEKDADPLRELASFEHRDRVVDAKFSADGQWVVTACRDKQARVWDIGTREVLSTFVHGNWISTARISRCGTVLCTSCDDGHSYVFDVVTEQILYGFGAGAPVTCAEFAPDGDVLVTAAKATLLGGAGQLFGLPPPNPDEAPVEKPPDRPKSRWIPPDDEDDF